MCIIGAGAAGLTLANALSSSDIELSICDTGKAGQGAIAASAGMIAPGVEAVEALDPSNAVHRAYYRLMAHGAQLWPGWAAALAAASGMEIGYRARGALIVRPDGEAIARLLETAAAFGISTEAVSPEVPVAAAHTAIFLPGEASLDAKALAAALEAAVRRAGVQMHEGVAADRLLEAGGRIRGVRFADGREQGADMVVIAAGWAAARLHPSLEGLGPVKGQALMLDTGSDVSHWPLLRGEEVYLAAKSGGRVVIGASVEPGASDHTVDALTRESLLEKASALVPDVASWPVVDHWAGVRPAFPDRMVRAGEVMPGLYVAAGAHRNGILLAPAIAQALAAEITGGEHDVLIAPFAPARG